MLKKTLTDIWAGFFHKKFFWPRLFVTAIAVILMGLFMSILLKIDFGVDPCTLMNSAMANKVGWTLGNFQATLNTVLLLVVVVCGGRNLGFGTIFNMLLVGYSIDFFTWVWEQTLPADFFSSMTVRLVLLLPALICFVFVAALYMDMDMGQSPYDAIPLILAKHLPKVSFRIVRMCFDFTVTVLGFLFGGMPGVVTILMVLTLGPVIAYIGAQLNKKFHFEDN